LRKRLLHHLDEEEKEVFPVAGKVLSAGEKVSLADEYRADMERRKAE
jgi:hemerythrin-like domain-containing protein